MEAAKETKFGTKVALEDEDDAQTSITCIAQTKRVIPHSMIKNNCNIIDCFNNTHQGVPRTGKQTIHTRIDRTEVWASTVPYRIHKICTWNGKL